MAPFVVVSGLPGSGKTTLARGLAHELGLPLLSKDTIKESLFDSLGRGEPLALGGPVVLVATDRPVDAQAIAGRIRSELTER